jgi:hypothetical protein
MIPNNLNIAVCERVPCSGGSVQMTGYRNVSCMDTVGFHMEVFRMVIPDDWVCYGGITWNGEQCIAMPTILQFAIMSPEGSKALEFFPDYIFQSGGPVPESSYFRTGPPMEPEQAVLGWILNQHRRQMQPYRVVGQGPLPPTEQMLWIGGVTPQQDSRLTYKFGGVRIAYDVHGIPMEEDFWAQVALGQTMASSMWGIPAPVTITILKVFSCRAPLGDLNGMYGTFRAMVQSLKMNPGYAQRSKEFTLQKVAQGNAASQQIMQWSRQQSAQNNRWLQQQAQKREAASREFEINQQRYKARLEAERDLSQKRSNATLGQETVINPQTGERQQVEGGHVDAYISDLGQILYSDKYGYNPNEHLSGNWQRMDPVY